MIVAKVSTGKSAKSAAGSSSPVPADVEIAFGKGSNPRCGIADGRRPLTTWELPSLLAPTRRHRSTAKTAVMRPHYAAICGFVYRNRYALASQIQRRFPDVLRSGRTARRHLAELESLRLLSVVPTRSVGPLFPKVYYVTGRGVRQLREELAAQGRTWLPSSVDRASRHTREGHSAEHVLHEVFVTEFMLAVWQTIHERADLELLAQERRSLARHAAFEIRDGRRPTRLIPDAMFMFRQRGGGMMVCFVEMDLGSMTKRQLQTKFRRYETWARSQSGQEHVVDLYCRHGAANPRPVFRVLFVVKHRDGVDDAKRLTEVINGAQNLPESLRRCLWLATVDDLRRHQADPLPLERVAWRRVMAGARQSAEAPMPTVPLFPAIKLRKDYTLTLKH